MVCSHHTESKHDSHPPGSTEGRVKPGTIKMGDSCVTRDYVRSPLMDVFQIVHVLWKVPDSCLKSNRDFLFFSFFLLLETPNYINTSAHFMHGSFSINHHRLFD